MPLPSETSPITAAPAPSPNNTAVERSVKSVILIAYQHLQLRYYDNLLIVYIVLR